MSDNNSWSSSPTPIERKWLNNNSTLKDPNSDEKKSEKSKKRKNFNNMH